jgi:hypothetical protein
MSEKFEGKATTLLRRYDSYVGSYASQRQS